MSALLDTAHDREMEKKRGYRGNHTWLRAPTSSSSTFTLSATYSGLEANTGCLGCSLSTKWTTAGQRKKKKKTLTHTNRELRVIFFLAPVTPFYRTTEVLAWVSKSRLTFLSCITLFQQTAPATQALLQRNLIRIRIKYPTKWRVDFYPLLSPFLYFDCGGAVKVSRRCSSTSVL